MASKFIPSQNRYFDPYQQRLNSGTSGTSGHAPINTAYPQKYLSRVSNQQFLKAIGNNVVMRGIVPTCTYVGPTARITLSAGVMIHDDTLIELTTTNDLDFDVTAYGDTPVSGSHLCIFSNFQYLETPDVDLQTQLALTMYHVNSTGLVVSGSPAFNATRNKILIAIIDFTKSGINITSISKSSLTSLSIMGTIYYAAGADPNNSVIDGFLDVVLGIQGTSGSSGTTATSGTSVGSGDSGTSADVSGSSGSAGSSGDETGRYGTSGTSGEIVSGSSGTEGTSGTSDTFSGTSGTSASSSGTSGAEINGDDILELLFLDNSQL